jgi:hypothetical protein
VSEFEVSHPLLDTDQEWHRQRAQLRANHLRPPPLVTAGLDLSYDPDSQTHQRVQVAGMALIFGIFPTSCREFIELARTRLSLGNQSQRSELNSVLNTRIQALWAWLPSLQQDCYLELDHATDQAHVWLMGPAASASRDVDLDEEEAELDRAFLAAFVMTSSRHWGGHDGLERVIERYGRSALLAAAQVAEALERQGAEPENALAFANKQWPALLRDKEAAWEPLCEREHPWACVQLGRLALRLRLIRAARLLLSQAYHTEAPSVAFFDLGQACEALDDLVGAETAFVRYTTAQADDPDGWRRLLFCRLRLGLFNEVETTLGRYRDAGGEDNDIITRLLYALEAGEIHAQHATGLIGWLGTKLKDTLARRVPVASLTAEIVEQHFGGAGNRDTVRQFLGHLDELRAELTNILSLVTRDEPPTSAIIQRAANELVRIILLCLPLLPTHRLMHAEHATAEDYADLALDACGVWSTLEHGHNHGLDLEALRPAVLAIAELAIG